MRALGTNSAFPGTARQQVSRLKESHSSASPLPLPSPCCTVKTSSEIRSWDSSIFSSTLPIDRAGRFGSGAVENSPPLRENPVIAPPIGSVLFLLLFREGEGEGAGVGLAFGFDCCCCCCCFSGGVGLGDEKILSRASLYRRSFSFLSRSRRSFSVSSLRGVSDFGAAPAVVGLVVVGGGVVVLEERLRRIFGCAVAKIGWTDGCRICGTITEAGFFCNFNKPVSSSASRGGKGGEMERERDYRVRRCDCPNPLGPKN